MPNSELQEPFMVELAECCHATAERITRRLSSVPEDQVSTIVRDELRGLYHGIFVVLDGGSSLADRGLVKIVDEEGNAFDRNLHERCFDHWPNSV